MKYIARSLSESGDWLDSTAKRPPAAGTDVSVPNVARIYDLLLGGKDNFASDRQAAEELIKVIPDARMACRQNRKFLERAVKFLADGQGVRQFIDIGTGLPTRGNVHEVARKIDEGSRVVYVDNDTVVTAHAQALLVDAPKVVAINRDLRNPREIINHPACQALIDFDKPVAILLIAILHFVSDDAGPHGIVEELKSALPSGSYLVISHATADDIPPGAADRVREVYSQASASASPRTRSEIMRFFHDLDMVPPGLSNVSDWHRGRASRKPEETIFVAGVGRKS